LHRYHRRSQPADSDNRHGKFIFEAWKHPQTLAIVSKIAGVDLVPVMDYEIGHINLSIPGERKEYERNTMISEDDEEAIVGWHRDSYPFVCVLMMSDCTSMIGGETALRTGTGDIKKVRGPQKAGRLSPKYHIHTDSASGMCCRLARPLHRSPSPPSLRWTRTHHHGDIFPTALSKNPR
jgi:hypothetical protein